MVGDSIVAPPDRELVRKLTAYLALLFLLCAAFFYLHRLYGKKFFDHTGQARWIWAQHRMTRNVPLVFYAARDFELPERRLYTKVKLYADPEYTLFFNGKEVASRRAGEDRHLYEYDVSTQARTGRNRLLVAVRSANGVGGLIAGVDIGPEMKNYLVTGKDWKIFRNWSHELPFRDAGRAEPAMTLGQPPAGKWNYLSLRPGDVVEPPQTIIPPQSSFTFQAVLPSVEIRDGVAVVVPRRVQATAYDFGAVAGRVRLSTIDAQPSVPPSGRVRLANAREEVLSIEGHQRPFVFGPGESAIVDPESSRFRYVVVYGGRARAEVAQ